MQLTPHRQALIANHATETRRLMLDCAFELNDLVRFAISASKGKGHKVYYPMDPVDESIRDWRALSIKLARLTAEIERHAAALGVRPFDPEEPVLAVPDADPPLA
jgi:hypothetical protein